MSAKGGGYQKQQCNQDPCQKIPDPCQKIPNPCPDPCNQTPRCPDPCDPGPIQCQQDSGKGYKKC